MSDRYTVESFTVRMQKENEKERYYNGGEYRPLDSPSQDKRESVCFVHSGPYPLKAKDDRPGMRVLDNPADKGGEFIGIICPECLFAEELETFPLKREEK